MSNVRKMPAPMPNPQNQRYWDAAREGRLLVKRCKDCGEFHFYPRAICPFCFSDRTEWVESKGTGSIYSYSVMRRGVPVQYAIAYVTLDEGVTMLTNMSDDTNLDALSIGQRVQVAFKSAEDGSAVPVFKPA